MSGSVSAVRSRKSPDCTMRVTCRSQVRRSAGVARVTARAMGRSCATAGLPAAAVRAAATTQRDRDRFKRAPLPGNGAVLKRAREIVKPGPYARGGSRGCSGPNQREHLVAFLGHLLRRRRLEVEAQERLGIRRPDVEMPVRVID